MTSVRYIEQRITRNLLRRREREHVVSGGSGAERLITIAAVTVGMLVLGSYLQELLWVLLAGAAVLTLGTRTP
ncbi:MAG: hypothetical protein V2I26_07480 [Halieaceae bacterium]|jgi:hypothetical protein|nr:hypothetical protein [Halieaceae bacterium]